MRHAVVCTFIVLGFLVPSRLSDADEPDSRGLQELFDLSAERSKLALERELLDRRMASIDERLADLEKKEFAKFDRVADPRASDYWESISDTVLLATATQDIVKGELLLYHAPGIYRVKEVKPKLKTSGECWYFRPDRDIVKGQQITIALVYDAPEEIALIAKGFAPGRVRGSDPDRPFNTKITFDYGS